MTLSEFDLNEVTIGQTQEEAEAHRQERRDAARAAFDRLPPEERELVERRWVFDQGSAEIARAWRWIGRL